MRRGRQLPLLILVSHPGKEVDIKQLEKQYKMTKYSLAKWVYVFLFRKTDEEGAKGEYEKRRGERRSGYWLVVGCLHSSAGERGRLTTQTHNSLSQQWRVRNEFQIWYYFPSPFCCRDFIIRRPSLHPSQLSTDLNPLLAVPCQYLNGFPYIYLLPHLLAIPYVVEIQHFTSLECW